VADFIQKGISTPVRIRPVSFATGDRGELSGHDITIEAGSGEPIDLLVVEDPRKFAEREFPGSWWKAGDVFGKAVGGTEKQAVSRIVVIRQGVDPLEWSYDNLVQGRYNL
jgi:hypothetical protein